MQASKYIYCPVEMQSNHSSPEFAVQVRCWLVRSEDKALEALKESTENLSDSKESSKENSGELIGAKPINELIAIQCFVRTLANVRVPFKSIRLRAITSGLIRFDLNLLEKFSEQDLKNVMSAEIELRLDNGFKERLVVHFKHQNLFRNLDGSGAADEPGQFNLKLNRFEARINETATVYVESSLPVRGFWLVALASGQLLSAERIEGALSRSIQIREAMFPYLELIAWMRIGEKLVQSKASLKINRKPAFNSRNSQILTSFNKVDNSSRLRIKLWSVSDSFIHLRSIKRHLSQTENSLDLVGYLTKPDADFFSSISHCFLVDEALDKCINRYKLNEPEANPNSLSTAVDSLFLNQTKRPFAFDVLFFSEY